MAGSSSDIDSPGDLSDSDRRHYREATETAGYVAGEAGKTKKPLQKARIAILAFVALGALYTVIFPPESEVNVPPLEIPTPTVIPTNTTLIYPPSRSNIFLPTPPAQPRGPFQTPRPPQGSPSPKPSPSPSQPPGFFCNTVPQICSQGRN